MARTALVVLGVAAAVFALSRSAFSKDNLLPSLSGQVAVVTGGSRGIGKGIAVALGEAGATVYITGRTLAKGAANSGGVNGTSQKGSLEETCDLVRAAGGRCVPLAVDSGSDEQLQRLMAQVVEEQGRLDVLVNNAFSAVSYLPKTAGQPFWEKGVEAWDQMNHVGLRSHYVASVFAAQQMRKAQRGLIVNVGSFGGLDYIFDVAYGIGKTAMDRMAHDMAVELFTENITMVSIWPGLVKTENVEDGALVGMKERRGRKPGDPEFDMANLLPTPLAETPLFSGRAVAALARDVRKMDFTGKVLVPAVMASGYGFTDERGVRSPPFTSVKFLLSIALKPVLSKYGAWSVPGGCFRPEAGLSDAAKLWWNSLPDLSLPSSLLKLMSGSPDL